ncbi:TatD family hydrolase [archaeon]|jgi:TatD DNase family protein|nr:TatD family hydrolase [archaeon]
MLIDAHAHMDYEQFEKDLDKVITSAEENNFVAIISNGTGPASNRKVLELSKKYNIIKPALGIYPIEALEMSDEEIDEEIEFIKKSNPLAIGEVGIDYYHTDVKEKQKINFIKFIKLSKELNIPIIVHSRNAEEDVVQILEEEGAKKVLMHCFSSGKKELAERIEKNGWYFSIPATIVRNKTFKKLVKRISMDRILTETDAPFLSPFKEKRNEPSFIKETIKKIAEIKQLTEKEVEDQIYSNYKRLFSNE